MNAPLDRALCAIAALVLLPLLLAGLALVAGLALADALGRSPR